MAQILDGLKVSKEIKEEIRVDVVKIVETNRRDRSTKRCRWFPS